MAEAMLICKVLMLMCKLRENSEKIIKHLKVYGYIKELNKMQIIMLILMMISRNHLDTNKTS